MSDERITDIPIPNECKNCIFSAFKQFQPRWIPVESEPPEFGKEVLISHKGAVSIDWLTQSEGWAYFFVSGVAIADIDAWMPLPKPYERSADEQQP